VTTSGLDSVYAGRSRRPRRHRLPRRGVCDAAVFDAETTTPVLRAGLAAGRPPVAAVANTATSSVSDLLGRPSSSRAMQPARCRVCPRVAGIAGIARSRTVAATAGLQLSVLTSWR